MAELENKLRLHPSSSCCGTCHLWECLITEHGEDRRCLRLADIQRLILCPKERTEMSPASTSQALGKRASATRGAAVPTLALGRRGGGIEES